MEVYEAWLAFEFTIHRPPLRQFIGDQPLRPPVGLGQYASVCYTGRIGELGVSASIGTVGDSYDNAMAESVMGIFKTELHRNPAVLADNVGHWKGLDDLEIAICA